MDKFILKAPYQPTGDQPQAIEQLVKGFKEGNQCQPASLGMITLAATSAAAGAASASAQKKSAEASGL